MKNFLDRASIAYYAGTPIISDAEFDCLAAHFDYDTVGHKITGGLPHYYPMYSLKKCFDLAEAKIPLAKCVRTPKLDGAAISILYVAGKLSLALTRGDGKIGQDITEKAALLVPNAINSPGVTQVTGEILAPKSIPNARNYAAGALNLKDINEFHQRELLFVAYDRIGPIVDTYTENMQALKHEGFKIVTDFDYEKFPTDGWVYRVDNNKLFEELGYTASHPRGALALKERKDGVVTTLLDVVWQVGKSGVVSPVAILEPVIVGEALVSKATLHNIEYISNLNLEIGCKVEVIRAGEIIPRIVRRVE